ncbi:hypothetical protein U9M48_025984 [Paspalum notatum var. saurae]|uniref:BED-type domain-containing protein n=1 Tax=Paspalum notatum var. saurae TaxID=547442 RepID=A0AAQ3TRJ6_PASNO
MPYLSVLSHSRTTITPSPLSSHGRKRKRTPTSTPEVAKVKPSSGQKHEKIVPRPQGAGVQPSNSTERKRTSLQSSTPEVTKVQPSSGENHERNVPRPQGAGVQPSNSTERNETSLPTSTPNGRKMHPSSEENPLLEVEGSDHSGLMKVRVEGTMQSNLEYGDAWVDEEVGAWEDWEDEDMDENPNAGYVEGRIDPEMVDSFLYGEENRQFRSKVWDEFSKIRVGGIVTKGRCNHCNAVISAKRGHGTSAMGTHLKRCKVRKNVTKVTSQLKSAVMSPEGIALKDWRFNQEVSRRELHRMISLHGFPLSVVDYDGFRRFVSSLNPVFKMVSRRTISDDCIKAFQEQKKVLQDVLKNATSRVSLTMDMWKSNQTLGYICITGHFTDSDWKMHKKILKFSFLETPHTGLAMFNVLLKFIQEWNIEDKLFAITLDNASNNNAMMKLLKKNLLDKHMLLGDGTLFHQRCGGHVLNLVCKAGFQVINPIIHKIRESVKYMEGSTSRKQKFEEIIHQLGISCRKRPNIDISTRWNSTYLMLETCIELKRAFESLDEQDLEYTYAPAPEEWEKARSLCGLLKTFFDATVVVSGSCYPTANLHFHEIWEVKLALENAILEADDQIIEAVKFMHRKFKRYWKLTWLQISFPVLFDPRFKLPFLEFRLKQAFGDKAESEIATLKKVLLELFKDYKKMVADCPEVRQGIDVEVVTDGKARYADWDTHVRLTAGSTSEVPSELESYLTKPPIPRCDNFDILAWWKSNALEYPTLSCMARDILVIPASSVPSESAFSMGRRIISDFRSRLAPKTVEALICLQDWIRGTGTSQFSMEAIDHFIGQHAERHCFEQDGRKQHQHQHAGSPANGHKQHQHVGSPANVRNGANRGIHRFSGSAPKEELEQPVLLR